MDPSLTPFTDPHLCFECTYPCDCTATEIKNCVMCSICIQAKQRISQHYIDVIMQQFYRGTIQVRDLDRVVD